MLKLVTFATVSALALAMTVAPMPAQAENGRNGAAAAGAIGGLAVGAIVGSQMNRDNDGYRDERYRARYNACHMERREFEDRYGNIHVRRVRVCD